MIIQKFGGTSVGSAAAIRNTKNIVSQAFAQGQEPVVVVSAASGITNLLLQAAQEASQHQETFRQHLQTLEDRQWGLIRELLLPARQGKLTARIKVLLNELEDILQGLFHLGELTKRSSDLVASFGERFSALLIAEYLEQEGLPALSVDARTLLLTDNRFGSARPLLSESYAQIRQAQTEWQGRIPVVTGFIASTLAGQTTTLGRGGSDYTAALLGAALEAHKVEIWTDVPGMMSADPRRVPKAFTQPEVSYAEAMELAHFGAKVIYPPTLQPAMAYKIPIRICNTFAPEHPGTLITEQATAGPSPIRGLSSLASIELLNVSGTGLMGVSGMAGRLFTTLSQHQVNVILISQASSEHSICVAVSPEEAPIAQQALATEFGREIHEGLMDPIERQAGLSVLALVGENMRASAGVSGKLYHTLGANGINVVASAQGSSELNISVVIAQSDLPKALNALHDAFFAENRLTLHLYLAGPGLIGSTLLAQLHQQTQFLAEKRGVEIKLLGLANSRTIAFDSEGLPLENWQEVLASGAPSHAEAFLARIAADNRPNSVFVDCTSGEVWMPHYERLLRQSVAVVTPNKRANSGSQALFDTLYDTALRHNTRFLYETNAGAGLPIINTLKALRDSGDELLAIEGVLSGTLSYIFNTFGPDVPFHQAVRQAQEAGYTEPDPRDDLSGLDMARKVLILARVAGFRLEPEDIRIDPILPLACQQAPDVPAFYQSLESHQAHFDQLSQEASQAGKKLRYIGQVRPEGVSIQLQAVGPDSPFFAMSGADNLVAFTTARYRHQPLVVKGPGAGAQVTAAGVFAEIVSLASR